MATAAWPFIVYDACGVAIIEGARTKVIDVARDRLAYGWDADQIHRQHPYLPLPQVHAALGYYHDHSGECDRQIAQRQERTNVVLATLENRERRQRLARLKASQ